MIIRNEKFRLDNLTVADFVTWLDKFFEAYLGEELSLVDSGKIHIAWPINQRGGLYRLYLNNLGFITLEIWRFGLNLIVSVTQYQEYPSKNVFDDLLSEIAKSYTLVFKPLGV